MNEDPFSEGVRQTLAIIEDHWPEAGVDQHDSPTLMCVCGWREADSIGWYQHLDNAVDESLGSRGPTCPECAAGGHVIPPPHRMSPS